jgi:hypothetical protein
MTLIQSGGTVTGKAPSFFNSTIEATVSGSKLEGLFITDKTWLGGGSMNDIVFSLDMSSDGQSFNGYAWPPEISAEDLEYFKETDYWMRGGRIGGGGINLLIVPVNLQDQAINNSKAYYDGIAGKLVSYFRAVSYGNLSVNVEVYQHNSEWVTLPKTTAQYRADEYSFYEDVINCTDDEVDFAAYDYSDDLGKGTVAFISSTDIWGFGSCILRSEGLTGKLDTDDGTKVDAIYTFESRFQEEKQVVRGLAHEFAHALGKILVTTINGVAKGGRWTLPDEYKMGNVNNLFSLMGESTNKSLEQVHLDSYTKEWLGWLKYSYAQINMSYNIKQLDLMKYGDSVLTYRGEGVGDISYIFEVRSNSSTTWDSETPNNMLLAIYCLENGQANDGTSRINLVKTLTKPGNMTDPNVGIVTKLLSLYEQYAEVTFEKFNASNLVGAVASISGKVLAAVAAMVLPETGFSILPDMDLHAYDGNGKHVGMNYQTGVYENQIDGAITSGDLIGGTEWIFAPDNVNVRFVTDSRDTAKFFQEYPEAYSYSNGSETYTLKMVYYSPDGSRHESEPAEHEISPGSTINHGYTVTGNADGSYSITTSSTSQPPSSSPSDGNQQTNLPIDPLIIVGIVAVIAIVVGVFLVSRSKKHHENPPADRQQLPPPPPPPPP